MKKRLLVNRKGCINHPPRGFLGKLPVHITTLSVGKFPQKEELLKCEFPSEKIFPIF